MNIYDLVRNPRDYTVDQLQAMSMIVESLADVLDLNEFAYSDLLNCARDFDMIALDKLHDMHEKIFNKVAFS